MITVKVTFLDQTMERATYFDELRACCKLFHGEKTGRCTAKFTFKDSNSLILRDMQKHLQSREPWGTLHIIKIVTEETSC